MDLQNADTVPYMAPTTAPTTRQKSLNQYANEFLAEVLNPNTRKAYAGDLRHFLELTRGDLRDEALLVYREFLISDTAPRTARRRLGVISSFLDSLVLKGVLAYNLYGTMRRKLSPKVDKHDSPTEALEDHEVRSMIDYPDRSTLLGASQRLAFVLSFHLGVRRSELTGIRLSDFTGDVLVITGKGNKKRELSLPTLVLDEIRSYCDVLSVLGMELDESCYLLRCQKTKDGSRCVHTETINNWFKDVAKDCKIEKKVTTHVGRATAITKLLDEETPIRDVANYAGHSDVNTTQIYDKKKRVVSGKVVSRVRY